ncbi:hypothetical protein LOTGIDRAFT_161214 [Lottia gigantea]|uniref:Uncharacterized protein n=1 Tax=Lottia gigantea TaxID=225164 RepID=V3ZSU0_LOTGI|nr:hypothetical protein LOTGIDRAFT_161214 [Lottia gigantea]ESO94513.1 hypothetical protein LOTGIDRAFT_161214 [Lottia gigantea]
MQASFSYEGILKTSFSSVLPLGLSFARSLSPLDDNYWLDNLDKRNSWWSKKSVDDFNNISQQGDTIEDNQREDSSASLYSCYVENCVPDFIACSKTSSSKSEFKTCKIQHRVCSRQCWTISRPDRL